MMAAHPMISPACSVAIKLSSTAPSSRPDLVCTHACIGKWLEGGGLVLPRANRTALVDQVVEARCDLEKGRAEAADWSRGLSVSSCMNPNNKLPNELLGQDPNSSDQGYARTIEFGVLSGIFSVD